MNALNHFFLSCPANTGKDSRVETSKTFFVKASFSILFLRVILLLSSFDFCFEVANDLGYGATLQDFTLKLQLHQTFTVTNISKGEREYDQKEIEGMFPSCDILEISSHVIKYIKMVEAVFTVNTRLDTDHFRTFLEQNYSHTEFRRPRSPAENASFNSKLKRYCQQTFCGDFGLWTINLVQ